MSSSGLSGLGKSLENHPVETTGTTGTRDESIFDEHLGEPAPPPSGLTARSPTLPHTLSARSPLPPTPDSSPTVSGTVSPPLGGPPKALRRLPATPGTSPTAPGSSPTWSRNVRTSAGSPANPSSPTLIPPSLSRRTGEETQQQVTSDGSSSHDSAAAGNPIAQLDSPDSSSSPQLSRHRAGKFFAVEGNRLRIDTSRVTQAGPGYQTDLMGSPDADFGPMRQQLDASLADPHGADRARLRPLEAETGSNSAEKPGMQPDVATSDPTRLTAAQFIYAHALQEGHDGKSRSTASPGGGSASGSPSSSADALEAAPAKTGASQPSPAQGSSTGSPSASPPSGGPAGSRQEVNAGATRTDELTHAQRLYASGFQPKKAASRSDAGASTAGTSSSSPPSGGPTGSHPAASHQTGPAGLREVLTTYTSHQSAAPAQFSPQVTTSQHQLPPASPGRGGAPGPTASSPRAGGDYDRSLLREAPSMTPEQLRRKLQAGYNPDPSKPPSD